MHWNFLILEPYDTLNHLFYMDDLKTFAKDDDQQQGLLAIVKTFSSDIKMELGLEKCAKATFKRGRLISTSNIISTTLSPSNNWSEKELTDICG